MQPLLSVNEAAELLGTTVPRARETIAARSQNS